MMLLLPTDGMLSAHALPREVPRATYRFGKTACRITIEGIQHAR